MDSTPAPAITPNTFAVDPNFRVGYAQNWQLSVQRDLPGSLQLTANYLGIKGTRGTAGIPAQHLSGRGGESLPGLSGRIRLPRLRTATRRARPARFSCGGGCTTVSPQRRSTPSRNRSMTMPPWAARELLPPRKPRRRALQRSAALDGAGRNMPRLGPRAAARSRRTGCDLSAERGAFQLSTSATW